MNKKYLGIGVLALVFVSAGLYFIGNNTSTDQDNNVTGPITSTEIIPDPTVILSEEEPKKETISPDNTEIISLIEADIASSAKRTLEITGWKKLGDENWLEFTGKGIEIWFPEEWFTNSSIDGGAGSWVSLYRWPDGMERTEENRDLLRQYLTELTVVNMRFSSLSSRVLSLNEDYLRNYTPYISYEDTISEMTVSGFKAKKVTRLFLKTDRTTVTQYSLVFENLPQGFEFVDISISDGTYTNAEEILDEIINRIRIKTPIYAWEDSLYNNLNNEEKEALVEAYFCRNTVPQAKRACKANVNIDDALKNNVRLVSLQNDMAAVYHVGRSKNSGDLYVYDLKKQELVEEITNVNNLAFGHNYIIYAKSLPENKQVLQLYRPGMSGFINITGSEIDTDPQTQTKISYVEYRGPFYGNEIYSENFPIVFEGDKITVFIHTHKYTKIEDYLDNSGLSNPGYLEYELTSKTSKTFDLSNIF